MPYERIASYANERHLTAKYRAEAMEACEACEAWCTCKQSSQGKHASNAMFIPGDAADGLRRAFNWGSTSSSTKRMGVGNPLDVADRPCNDGTLIADYLCTARPGGSSFILSFGFTDGTSRPVAWYKSKGGLMGRDRHVYLFDPDCGEYRFSATAVKEFVAKYFEDLANAPAGRPATFRTFAVVDALKSRRIANDHATRLKADRLSALRNKRK